MDENRKAASARGGKKRWTDADPDEVAATRRLAAAATNAPVALARRIVKAWPGLTRAERAEVREILAAIMPRERR